MGKVAICLLCCIFLIGCDLKERNGSAPKDDSKVAQEEKGEFFPKFQTKDLEGNEVTDAIFSEKEITMINFWGSTCGPCLEELDELQEIYEKLNDKGTIIGILADVPLGYLPGEERAKEAVEKAKATYRNLVLDESLREYASDLSLTPYTIFVDKEGRMLEKKIKGARIDAYIEALTELIPDLELDSIE